METTQIKNLQEYTKTPNTITGKVFTAEIKIENLIFDKERLIRIYLPSDYFKNPTKRFPVIYMMDGKNLFDKYTSFMGEWGIDEIIEKRLEEGKESYIVVGIDSATDGNERCQEMAPSGTNLTSIDDLPNSFDAYGDILGDYIVNTLIKEIDKLFRTNKEYSIGGSSMGGLFAFFMGQKYPNIFKNSICFSPAFCLYEKTHFIREMKKLKVNNNKFYLLVGNLEYEHQFIELTKYTYEYMLKIGFPNVKYVFDVDGIHHETFWNKYFDDALEFIKENYK